VILMFCVGVLAWTLLFVVNRQGWSNFTPWKVRQISVFKSASQGTGSPFSTMNFVFKHTELSSRVIYEHKIIWGGYEKKIGLLGNHCPNYFFVITQFFLLNHDFLATQFFFRTLPIYFLDPIRP